MEYPRLVERYVESEHLATVLSLGYYLAHAPTCATGSLPSGDFPFPCGVGTKFQPLFAGARGDGDRSFYYSGSTL